MSEWMEDFISQCLTDVPPGKYRARTEKELRDHMTTLRQSLTEAEVLQSMGDPERLRREYEAAWRRSPPGRLEELGYRWVRGCAVMLGVQSLIASVIGQVWWMALSLPASSIDPQFRMIWRALRNLNNSLFWRHLFPLVCALIAGAYYLGRKFQPSRPPVWQISVGLSFHWAAVAALRAYLRAIDNQYWPFWKAAARHFYYNAGYYALTLALCVLLGAVFGLLFGNQCERSRELA